MGFHTEPEQYEKTILSDLQGAWESLRESVVRHSGFPDWERLLFHIHDAMSWESVRDLEKMRQSFLLIQNIANSTELPEEIEESIESVREDLTEVLALIAAGEKL